jgi:hypothetical protein
MIRWIALALANVAVLACGSLVFAQLGSLRGVITKFDAANERVTIRGSDGKEHEYSIEKNAQIRGPDSQFLKGRLKALEKKIGAPVIYKVVEGKEDALEGLKILEPGMNGDTTGFKPLTELAQGKYHDFEGGLYPGGSNQRPADHEAAGLAIAGTVQPLAPDGKPRPEGRIVLLSIGMSNTSQEFTAFQKMAKSDGEVNPRVLLVNGAQRGMTAAAIQNPHDQYDGTKFWTVVEERLQEAGVTADQVQAVWLKQADLQPESGFPRYARTLEAELLKIVQVLHDRFPNLRLTYLSSRIFAGFATMQLNPEPYAYESGFSVKWLIEKQIRGDKALNFDSTRGPVRAPWLSWGPYLWANGMTAREDGLKWEERDFGGEDGTHPSPAGQRKVARLLLEFFKSDSTTKGWFVAH